MTSIFGKTSLNMLISSIQSMASFNCRVSLLMFSMISMSNGESGVLK